MYKWVVVTVLFMLAGPAWFYIAQGDDPITIGAGIFTAVMGAMWAMAKYMEEFNAPERVMKRAKKLWRSGNSGKRIQSKRLLRTIAEDYPPAAKALKQMEGRTT